MLLTLNTEEALSVINNPFAKSKIVQLNIHYDVDFSGKNKWYAEVKFRNGLTKGQQTTPFCETLEEVGKQIDLILASVR